MTKREFIDELCKALRSAPVDEAQRTVSFYSEAIDDRIEDGMTEAEAVAAMGDPADIAREVVGVSPAAQVLDFDSEDGDKPVQREYRYPTEGVRGIDVQESSGDVTFIPTDGAEIVIRVTEGNGVRYNVTGGEIISVTKEVSTKKREKRLEILGVSLTIPFIGVSTNCDGVQVELPRGFAASLTAAASSGDIKCSVPEASSVSFRTGSGDIEISNLIASEKVSAGSGSGDLELSHVLAPVISVATSSGDLSISHAEAESLTAGTVSGDADIDAVDVTREVKLSSVSGDVHAELICETERISAGAVSGDVELTVHGSSESYTIAAASRSGDVDAPASAGGEKLIRAKTVSGDIRIELDA